MEYIKHLLKAMVEYPDDINLVYTLAMEMSLLPKTVLS